MKVQYTVKSTLYMNKFMKSTVHEKYMNSIVYEREKYMTSIQVQEIKYQ